MSEAREIVHITWGVSRADSVRDALRLQGCADRVIGLSHDWSVGPLDPRDPAARRAWLGANLRTDDAPSAARIGLEAPWIAATSPGVRPVYWVCLTDPPEHACFLEFASRMAGRPFEIVDATGPDIPGASGLAPVWSLGQLRPAEIVACGLPARRRPFTRAEADAASAAWARLRAENAGLRIVRDGRLVSAPLTQFDAVLIEQATPDRERLIALVARVLRHFDTEVAQPGQRCSYAFLFARILALGQAGALDVTGPGPGMRDYEVRRSGARPAWRDTSGSSRPDAE